MNENEINVTTDAEGKVVFAEDVVATIASLAAGEVEGVYSMSGTAMEGLGEMFGKKSYTKGVRVQVGAEECAADISVVIRYGYRIREVANNIQVEVKNAIETMTGLKMVEVNVYVNAVYFEPEAKPEEKTEIAEETAVEDSADNSEETVTTIEEETASDEEE